MRSVNERVSIPIALDTPFVIAVLLAANCKRRDLCFSQKSTKRTK